MERVWQVKKAAELGFAEAVHSQDENGKQFFMEVLMLVQKYETTKGHSVMPTVEEKRGRGDAPTMEDVKTRAYEKIQKPELVNVVAYYLSKYEHHDVFEGEALTQTQALDKIGDILGINRNSVRNMRDAYDSYTGSHREGWKKPLNDIQQHVFDKMEVKSKNEVLQNVRDILKDELIRDA